MSFLTRIALAAAVGATVITVSLAALAAEKKPQETCLVSGKKIDEAISLDREGQRIYFCSDKSRKEFVADPEKYFKKAAEEGVLLENVQTACPVMGGDPSTKFFRDYNGRRVLFCCAGCPPMFDKEPEKYLAKLAEQPTKPKDEDAKGEKGCGHDRDNDGCKCHKH
jgi:YHS domain-containing protein